MSRRGSVALCTLKPKKPLKTLKNLKNLKTFKKIPKKLFPALETSTEAGKTSRYHPIRFLIQSTLMYYHVYNFRLQVLCLHPVFTCNIESFGIALRKPPLPVRWCFYIFVKQSF